MRDFEFIKREEQVSQVHRYCDATSLSTNIVLVTLLLVLLFTLL